MIAMSLVAGAPACGGNAPLMECLFLWAAKTLLWWFFITLVFKKKRVSEPAGLQALSERLQWLALIPLSVDFYLLDLKCFICKIPGIELMPAMMDMAGLLLFIFYMAMVWHALWSATSRLAMTRRGFAEEFGFRLRMILPALIPFGAVSLLLDIVSLVPGAGNFFDTMYGRAGIIAFFLFVLLFLVPPMIRYTWRCEPLPEGALRERIGRFVAGQGLRFSDFLIWPLDSGLCTAAVVGVIPAFRYIMLTPCLVEHLSDEEIEAVLAHECAHVKKRHILWYVFFLSVYSFIAYKLFDVIWTWLGTSRLFVEFLVEMHESPALASFLTIVPVAGAMVIYFRFLIGYFMRNFERQADLAVFDIQPHPYNLINALEKIAILAGNIREKPNWHHFSIAERVEFLHHAAVRRGLVKAHEKKLAGSIAGFVAASVIVGMTSCMLPVEKWHSSFRMNFASIYLEQIAGHGLKSPGWYMAVSQLFAEHGRYAEAALAYEKALSVAPDNPDLLNNYAWFLVTVEDKGLRDPERALGLAEKAAAMKPDTGYILDTLALCLFRTGHVRRAMETEKRAIQVDPENSDYYRRQTEMFRSGRVD